MIRYSAARISVMLLIFTFSLVFSRASQAITNAELMGTWNMVSDACASGAPVMRWRMPDVKNAVLTVIDQSTLTVELETMGCFVQGVGTYWLSGANLTVDVPSVTMECADGTDQLGLGAIQTQVKRTGTHLEVSATVTGFPGCASGDAYVVHFEKQ